MRKSRFSENQIVGILKELKAGAKAAALCRKYGMSEATLYNWRSKYAGLEVELPRFRAGLRLGHEAGASSTVAEGVRELCFVGIPGARSRDHQALLQAIGQIAQVAIELGHCAGAKNLGKVAFR
jgi:hypothetical protein